MFDTVTILESVGSGLIGLIFGIVWTLFLFAMPCKVFSEKLIIYIIAIAMIIGNVGVTISEETSGIEAIGHFVFATSSMLITLLNIKYDNKRWTEK